MVNKRRGEVALTLNGQPYSLCLTLGAMAELEDTMGLDNIGELADRFASGKVKSSDLVKILGASLRAGGACISDQQAANMSCDGGAATLTKALVSVLQLAFNPASADAASPPLSPDGSASVNPMQADLKP